MNESWSRWSGYVLLSSLALNVFVIGLIVTRLVIGAPLVPHGAQPFEVKNQLNVAVRPSPPQLPAASRKFLVEAMDPHRKDVQMAMKRLNEARRALARALATEPYDSKSVEATLAELRNARTAFEQSTSAAVIESSANLPPQDRLLLAQMLENPGLAWRSASPNAEPETFQLVPQK